MAPVIPSSCSFYSKTCYSCVCCSTCYFCSSDCFHCTATTLHPDSAGCCTNPAGIHPRTVRGRSRGRSTRGNMRGDTSSTPGQLLHIRTWPFSGSHPPMTSGTRVVLVDTSHPRLSDFTGTCLCHPYLPPLPVQSPLSFVFDPPTSPPSES